MLSKQEFKNKFEIEFQKEKQIFSMHKKRSLIWLCFSTLLVVGAAIGLHFAFDQENEHIILYILIAVIAWFALACLPILSQKDKLVNAFAEFDLGRVLAMMFDKKIHYLREGFLPQELFEKSRFCSSSFNTYGGEDLFAFDLTEPKPGEECGRHLWVSDVYAKTIRTIDGKKTVTTHFDAALCAIQFRRPFKCTLDINSTTKRELEPLQTESSEFNKIFQCQTDNQIEARRILTITLMDKFLELQKMAGCKIGFAFREDFLYIYLKKELFSMSKKDDSFCFELVEPIYDDLAILESIATEVEHNKKIFKL